MTQHVSYEFTLESPFFKQSVLNSVLYYSLMLWKHRNPLLPYSNIYWIILFEFSATFPLYYQTILITKKEKILYRQFETAVATQI